MSAPDFAAILAVEGESTMAGYRPSTAPGADSLVADLWPHVAASQLAAKVHELCRTCGGKGTVRGMNAGPGDLPFTCPDCPTIGRLLAIGAAVMTGSVVGQPSVVAWVLGGET